MDAKVEFKVEKNIPMLREYHPSGESVYPFATMKVGDSFLFPSHLKRSTPYNIAKAASVRAKLAGKPHRYRARQTPNGCRCWRVA